jgi:carbon monoxide dehydrogenase subunit G
MELADTFRVQASNSKVWQLLWDLPRLAACLPGCEGIEEMDEATYRAHIKQSVGPFKMAMAMVISLEDVTPESRIVMAGGGDDRKGTRLKLNRGVLEVAPVSDNESEVSYTMDITLFGRMATLGYPVVKRKAGEMREEFTRRIVAELTNG